ncbi:hypothetical protein TNCV_1514001 [Trichonephila clavipes]|nr:hypothetical protein TNCV_1514001 [Trichonephila clavipes]
MFEKVSVLLDCPAVVLEEYGTVDEDKVCSDKDILEFVQNSKNVINANFDEENEMNHAASALMSSKTRNIM